LSSLAEAGYSERKILALTRVVVCYRPKGKKKKENCQERTDRGRERGTGDDLARAQNCERSQPVCATRSEGKWTEERGEKGGVGRGDKEGRRCAKGSPASVRKQEE